MEVKVLLVASMVLLLGCGCALQPLNTLSSMEDFRKIQPALDLKKLSSKKTLSLFDAQSAALQNNPTYQAAYQAVKTAKYRYYRSLAAYLPTVQSNMQISQSLRNNHHIKNPPAGVMPCENYFSSEATIQASWLIFDGFEREFAMLIAREDSNKSLLEDANARRLLLQAVAYAYYDVMLSEARKVIAEADLEFQDSSLKQAESRYRHGKNSMAEVLNFKILGNDARSAILSAATRTASARYALAALMGGTAEYLPEDIKLDTLQISGTFQLESLQTYCDMAIARRSDLAAARSDLQISRYRHLQGYSGFMPTVRFYFSSDFSNNNFRYGDYRYTVSRYNRFANSYGATADWNLFEGFATYNLIRELQSMEESAQYRLQERFLQVINEVSDARENIINASGQLELYRQSLEWVFEQRQLVQAEYNAAKTTITRLNGAQSDLIRAENMLAIAQIELNKAVIQLQTATEGDYSHLPQHKFLQPSTVEPFDQLLQKLTDKFKL